jgi:acyl-CoA thioester hydrolase
MRYRAPARLDDALEVTVAVRHSGRASMEVAQQAWRAQTLLAEGDVRIGCVDAASLRPCRIPTDLLHALA